MGLVTVFYSQMLVTDKNKPRVCVPRLVCPSLWPDDVFPSLVEGLDSTAPILLYLGKIPMEGTKKQERSIYYG